jgi:2-aminoadipate transaminase
MRTLQSSFIREILRVAAEPGVISFAGGLPDPTCFPQEELAEAYREVLLRDGGAALQYHTSEGYLPFRDAIAQRMNEQGGTRFSPEEVLITAGSQQGLDLLAKVAGPASTLYLESPGYLGAMQAFDTAGVPVRGIDTTRDGLDTAQLDGAISATPSSPGGEALLYIMPRFQNPTGRSFSASALDELSNTLGRHGLYAIEDDPYGELSFDGPPPAPLVSRHPERTIYLGSFSKSLAPSLRLGWVVAPEPVRTQLVRAKQAADLCSPLLPQKAVLRYLLDNDFDAQLRAVRRRYSQKWATMRRTIEEGPGAALGVLPPQAERGGMFLWLPLPPGTDEEALLKRCSSRRVVFVPGNRFRVRAPAGPAARPEAGIRLNFTHPSEEQIRTGMARIFEALEELHADSIEPAAV